MSGTSLGCLLLPPHESFDNLQIPGVNLKSESSNKRLQCGFGGTAKELQQTASNTAASQFAECLGGSVCCICSHASRSFGRLIDVDPEPSAATKSGSMARNPDRRHDTSMPKTWLGFLQRARAALHPSFEAPDMVSHRLMLRPPRSEDPPRCVRWKSSNTDVQGRLDSFEEVLGWDGHLLSLEVPPSASACLSLPMREVEP